MDIRYCRMCGAKVDENDDVCPRCGVKVTSPKTMKKKSSSKRNSQKRAAGTWNQH